MDKADFDEHLIVCPICLEIPRDEIFQCKNGHHICDTCFGPISSCPQCRVTYGKQMIRNRAMESLLDAMEFECPHKDLGCPIKVHRKGLTSHESSCQFRPIHFCKMIGYSKCPFVVPNIPQLTIAHLKQVHNVTVCTGPNLQINHESLHRCLDRQGEELEVDFGVLAEHSKNFKWEPILWKLEEDDYSPTFLLLCRLRGAFFQPKFFSWSCLYMGESVEESKQYRVEYSIKNVFGNGKSSRLNWQQSPSLFKSAEILLKEPPFPIPFSFFNDHVKGLMDPNNKKDYIRVHVSISKLPRTILGSEEIETDCTKLHILPMIS